MTATIAGDFGSAIGARMRESQRTLAARWLARLDELLPVEKNEVFPTDALLDHIPALITEIAEYLGDAESDFNPAMVKRMTYDGKLWAIPQVVDMQLRLSEVVAGEGRCDAAGDHR